MLAAVKTGEAAGRRNLRLRLVLEQITGKVQERGFVSSAMQDGIDREAEARGEYEALTGELVENTGFVRHDSLMVGCSLDGCVFAEDGTIRHILELKCPEPSAHLSYLRTGDIGAKYRAQILHSMWVTGAQSCDWMSYQPEFPESLRTRLVRVERDEAAIRDYEAKALAFLAEVEAECAELRKLQAA
jgi:hypothetical protein